MALINMLRDDDPGAQERGSKGTSPSQSSRNAGPAGKAVVGKSGMPKKDGAKDVVGPKSTKRSQSTSGKSSPQKASNPGIVTSKSSARKK